MPDDDRTEPLASDPLARRPLIGRTLGKLTVVELLGRGGSGEVYLAEQVQLGRSAVVKVLRSDALPSGTRVERFLREAKLASRLDHPYAAHIYGFGAEPDGVLWIAMEHVRGETLDAIIATRGPMPPAVFGALFARLCEVVHTAHELGIVHRDIKGSNVMVIERAGQLLPKLLDFGIAKGLGELVSPGTDGELTGHGATLGSPHYMAPEQWEEPAGVDARADIYALGVLAYRCIAGHLPFRDVPRSHLANAHLALPPPALPASVPAAIAEVIYRALAKSRDARWPTALALGEAVRAACGAVRAESVPAFDAATRATWERRGPQPIADAIVRLARASTTVEADAALRELVAIACRWYAVVALAHLGGNADGEVRERVRAIVGRDDALPWLLLARAAAHAAPALPGLADALAQTQELEALASRLDDRDRQRSAAALAADIATVPAALAPLEALLDYQLVVGRALGAESWQGTRRRDRERVVVWGEPLRDGEVALLDPVGRVVARLSPLVQVVAPLPAGERELFLLWRSGRGAARLVAAPWGYERDDEAAAARLGALTTQDGSTVEDAAGDASPYRGLQPYGVGDAELFVGREREVEALANRLVRAPMVAVLGPSGAGKSSFVHAGLLPRLDTRALTLRPGRHPVVPPLTDVRDLVIVVDQLEELVTLCRDPDERARFAAALVDAVERGARLVVTLRDDFASVLETLDAFRGRFDVFVLATPPVEALRKIIVEPARRAQVSVEPRVVDEMVAEVAGRVASLPLLSFTAARLWEQRDRDARRITYEAYAALGGVAGALSTYADHVYGSLARRDQDVVRDLFARLVSTDGTRIPAPRAELEQLPGAPRVLAHLIDARLLVVRDEHDVDIVEIVHECLATRWDRLARWRSEDAADRALLADVRAAARRWREAAERADLLWRGEALAELRKLTTRSTALTESERAFAAAADHAERRARRVRRGLVTTAIAMLGAVAVVMAYLGFAANRSRRAAERSTRAAQTAAQLAEDRLTASLVAQGRRELNDDRALPALAYFGAAMQRGADSPALRFMIAIASRGWRDTLVTRTGTMTTSVAASARGAWIATADQEARIHFWDRDGKPRGQLATEVGWIGQLARMRDDRVVATGRDGLVVIDPRTQTVAHRVKTKGHSLGASHGPADDELVSIEEEAIRIYGFDGRLRRELAIERELAESIPVVAANGRHVTASVDGDVVTVDLVTLQRTTLARDIEGVLAGSPDGTYLGYIGKDGLAYVHRGDGSQVRTFKPEIRGHSLVLADDGRRIGVLGEHELVIHDGSGQAIHGMTVKSSLGQFVVRGDDTWIADATGTLRRYHESMLVASLPNHLGEARTLFVAGDRAITLGSDGSFAMTNAVATHLVLAPRPCERAAFSGDGIATTYECGERQHVFVGRTEVAVVPTHPYAHVAVDRNSGRAAIVTNELVVFDRDRKPIARTREPAGHLGALAFEDAEHLLVADPEERPGIWRWTIGTDRWEQVTALRDLLSVAVVAGGIAAGTTTGDVVLLRDGKVVSRVAVGGRVAHLVASADRRWLAATLVDGGTVIVDGTTGAVTRRMEPADALLTAANLDATGDLLIRPGRGTMTVWDRASGETLVFALDLLADMTNAVWSPDGRLEVTGRKIGVLDIARETRPAAAIVRDIACRVPLAVRDGKLEPATPECSTAP